MTRSNADDDRIRAIGPPGSGQRAARVRRSRPRPVATPSRKSKMRVRSQPPEPGHEDEIAPVQTLSVEIHPIGGIFGTPNAVLIEDDTPGLFGKLWRRRPTPLKSSEPALLDDIDFRVLWLSRLLSQTAQGALLYALLILVVDLSDRTVYTSLFVICSIIPSIAFGLPAGLVADSVPRRSLLVLLNLFRFAFMLLLVGSEVSLAGVFAATLGIWVIHQFYSPTEASVLADIVEPNRYTSAQAMFNLALTISQALGLVIAAPILLRIGGPKLVFVVAGTLWLAAAALTALLPALQAHRTTRRTAGRSLRRMLGDGWRFARSDRFTFEAMIDDMLVGVGMSALVVIMPFYLERVLGTSKENTVFVFAPAALGLVLGIRLAPRLARLIGEQYLATLSLFLFALVVGALGFVEQTYDFLNDTLLFPLDQLTNAVGVSPLIFVAMLLSIPAGFASAVVGVAARSILLSRTPANLRGQVIATQGLMGNIAALVPTVLAGIATDIFGVKPIAVGIAVCIVMTAMAAHMLGRRNADLPNVVPQT